MKLWKQTALFMTFILLLALGVCGGFTVQHMTRYSLEQTVENHARQMQAVSYAFEQLGNSNQIAQMSGTVKDSFLSFQFKTCCGQDYALVRGEQAVVNLTEFEVADTGIFTRLKAWDPQKPDYEIQKLGKKYILLMGKPVGGMEDYHILYARDISHLFSRIRQQALLFILVYLLVAALAVLAAACMMKHALHPLKVLAGAAAAISQGEWQQRVPGTGSRELRSVGEAFNRMAETVEAQVTELQEVAEKQKMLLGSLTHELKTPMTSVIGYSDSLLHVKLTQEQQKTALSYINRECRRLERLSGKMMNLTGLYENGEVELELKAVEELLVRVAQLEEHHLRAAKIEFHWGCEMGKIPMDMDLMESLLVNLIDNAIKASQPGGNIWLEARDHTLEVRDQGKGIPEGDLPRVTEAFYMADKSRSRREGGVGLGLALCKEIARIHKAELIIESTPGRGTAAKVKFSDAYNLFTNS